MTFSLLENHFLILPQIQALETLDLSAVLPSDEPLSIPVSDPFESIWTMGPQDGSLSSLDEALRVLVATLGKMICAGQGKVHSFAKTGPADLVTAVDNGIEMLFRIWISRFLPTHKIIGEEGFKSTIFPDDFVWYIDPVDGTTNFMDGSTDVALLIGCLYQGKPFWSVVALPFLDRYYSISLQTNEIIFWTSDCPNTPVPYPLPSWNAQFLGTEYMDSRREDARIFSELCSELAFPPLRVKSIGVNLSYFITGKLKAFYKPKAKLWDVMAPLSIASVLLKDRLDCEIIIPNGQCFPLFSNHADLYHWFNQCHKGSGNAGLVLAYPTHSPAIKHAILNHYPVLPVRLP